MNSDTEPKKDPVEERPIGNTEEWLITKDVRDWLNGVENPNLTIVCLLSSLCNCIAVCTLTDATTIARQAAASYR